MKDVNDVERVLVLDDDEMMRELLRSLLLLQGYEVETVSSGGAALERLSRKPGFHLVLSDLQMPGLEGHTLGTALRQSVTSTETLLIGMSGHTPAPEAERCFDAFLLKPFTMDRLRQVVQTARAEAAAKPDSACREEPLAEASNPEVPDQLVNETPPLNLGIVAALAAALPKAQLLELYAMTCDDVLSRHARISAAAAQGDLDTVHREAHAIKGGCGMVGATELYTLAAATEVGESPNEVAIREVPKAVERLRKSLADALQSA